VFAAVRRCWHSSRLRSSFRSPYAWGEPLSLLFLWWADPGRLPDLRHRRFLGRAVVRWLMADAARTASSIAAAGSLFGLVLLFQLLCRPRSRISAYLVRNSFKAFGAAGAGGASERGRHHYPAPVLSKFAAPRSWVWNRHRCRASQRFTSCEGGWSVRGRQRRRRNVNDSMIRRNAEHPGEVYGPPAQGCATVVGPSAA
jgi:hypothetical protein